MPTLRPGRPEEIDAILFESHALWGAGLDFPAYRDFWFNLMGTAFGRRRLRFLVWVDDSGTLLSSLKLYNPTIRLLGRTGRAAVLGAVFTPRAERSKGHAAAMIRAVLDEVRPAGDAAALLFTDIGVKYYEALGFRPLPAEEVTGRIDPVVPPPPGWALRPMEAADLDAVTRAHDYSCARRRITLLRDREHWEFLFARAEGYFSRFDGSGLARRYRVAERNGRFAGYLVSLEGDSVFLVREAGVPGEDSDALSAVLRLGAAEAARSGIRSVRAWLPPDAGDMVPEWHLERHPRRSAVPMVHTLGRDLDLSPLDDAGASFLPYLDQF